MEIQERGLTTKLCQGHKDGAPAAPQFIACSLHLPLELACADYVARTPL
jgi:hypothetical protein